MSISIHDVVPFTQARANLSELAEQVKAGAEKIITKNGESYVALIDDARQGLDDIAAGRTRNADAALASLQKKRKDAAGAGSKPVIKKRG